MTLDELLAAVVAYYAERGMTRPKRLRIEAEHETDSLDVPVKLAPGTAKPPNTLPPAARTAQRWSEDDEPSTAVDALRIAIFYAGQRQTGGQLSEFVLDRWVRWKPESLTSIASEEAKKPDGRIKYHLKDPGDGYGKGYGLSEWES